MEATEEKSRIEELEAQNAQLTSQIKALKEPGVTEEIAQMVQEKMAAGLTREQAIEVSRNQVLWDAELAKQEKAKAKAATKGAQS